MGWFSAFVTANLIGIGSNLDNSGVGLAYGSREIKFPHSVNLIVNVIGFCSAFLGAYAGKVISRYLPVHAAEWAACMVLVSIGLFFWYTAYIHPQLVKQSHCVEIKNPGWKEGIVLGLALSLTNIASGFGTTVSNAATVWATTVSIGVWGYIMIWLGNIAGIGIVAKMLGKYSSFAAGCLLIFVGIHQVLG